MKLKTYHAYSMAQALTAVKSDLGADAVILHTRIFQRGGILGFWRKTIVEVTATPAAPQQPLRTSGSTGRLKLRNVQAQQAYAGASKNQVVDRTEVSAEQDRQRTRKLALAMQEAHQRKAAEQAPISIAPKSATAATGPASVGPQPSERAVRRFILTSPENTSSPGNNGEIKAVNIHHAPHAVSSSALPEMQGELNAIRQMVGQVLQRQISANGQPAPAVPKQLFDFYLKLVAQDISNELADQIVEEVRATLSEQQLDDEPTVRAAVLKRVAALIPVCGEFIPPCAPDDRPFTIALVGPTGAGKTTTVAKIAATLKLRHGKTVGLITADSYRMAAVDQLRAYADILDLPMEVALTPAEMKRAINTLRDRDVILIDTAGRSQRDSGKISELKRFIAAANPHEVHLVLSSTAGEKVLLQEAAAFSKVGVHKILLTKLDEAVSFGVLVNVVRQVGMQLSFITTGQEVPEHLELGQAERLADLVLGGTLGTYAAPTPRETCV